MKKLLIITASAIFFLGLTIMSCNSQNNPGNDVGSEAAIQQEEGKTVTVYYFHGDRRCTTCKAVGSVSKETVAENFADIPNVVFKDINIDEAENNEIKDKLEMSGSGLFVFDGEVKKDLTAIAFQKAVSSPEDLSEKIIDTINELL